jgi:hypothetical protein
MAISTTTRQRLHFPAVIAFGVALYGFSLHVCLSAEDFSTFAIGVGAAMYAGAIVATNACRWYLIAPLLAVNGVYERFVADFDRVYALSIAHEKRVNDLARDLLASGFVIDEAAAVIDAGELRVRYQAGDLDARRGMLRWETSVLNMLRRAEADSLANAALGRLSQTDFLRREHELTDQESQVYDQAISAFNEFHGSSRATNAARTISAALVKRKLLALQTQRAVESGDVDTALSNLLEADAINADMFRKFYPPKQLFGKQPSPRQKAPPASA